MLVLVLDKKPFERDDENEDGLGPVGSSTYDLANSNFQMGCGG